MLAHLLFAQATLVLAALGVITGRISRWRPLWLAGPAAAGAAWTAQLGVSRAMAGFLAGPRQVLDYLTGAAGHPARLARLSTAFSGAGHWLPEQLPLALLLAAGETAAVGWLGRGGWLRGPGGPDGPDGPGRPGGPADCYRPGLIVALRRRRTVADLAAGEVVTRAGCALGLETATGRPAEIAWAQAQGGVLSVGAGHRVAALAALPLACAAARRHQTLIVIDLVGRPWLGGAVADACAAAGVRLAQLGPDEPGLGGPDADGSALGRWLGRAVSERTAVLLVAGPEGYQPAARPAARQTGAGPAARQTGAGPAGRQALADLAAVLRELGEQGLRGDGLAWIHGVTAADQPDLAGLPVLGAAAGTAVLLSTADEAAATALAEAVRVVVVAGPVGQGLEAMLRGEPLLGIDRSPGPTASALPWQDEGEFTIFERGPARRLRRTGQLVPGPWTGLQ